MTESASTVFLVAVLTLLTACTASASLIGGLRGPSRGPTPGHASGPSPIPGGRIPLIDMGARTYLGFVGGLYPPATNAMPSAHHKVGLTRANTVRLLDGNGNPSPKGKYVLLSVGMSNTSQEFCGGRDSQDCTAWSFMGQAAADSSVNHTALVIINGARGGAGAGAWTSGSNPRYDNIRDTLLAPQGLTERQVQAVWLKTANSGPTTSLSSSAADAYALETRLGDILRAFAARYPNLQQVFISSRIYGGYASSGLNPEPYAYESGLAVKWIIQAQIQQMQNGGAIVDPRAGDLNYNTVAPWIAWGPYLWANGSIPRSDGLTWVPADFESDMTHPSASGERKVAAMLVRFFRESPLTRCWFLVAATCP